MELVEKEIVFTSKKDKVFTLIPIGDIHLGNKGCDEQRLHEVVQYIKNKERCYWLGMGDYIDAINYLDPRFDSRQVNPRYILGNDQTLSLENMVERQVADFQRIVEPIKDKCIGLLAGNHEETIRKHHYWDITNHLSHELGVPPLGYCSFIRLTLKRKAGDSKAVTQYIIYATHGFGGSRKSGAKINRIEDLCHFFECDIALIGHEHKKIYTTVTRLGIQHNKSLRLVHRKTVGVMTGCFLRGYISDGQNYVERAGYSPTDLGVAKIYLNGVERDVHVSL
jgi:hypothetical protein